MTILRIYGDEAGTMPLEDDGDIITWLDTFKDRVMNIDKIIDSSPEHFVFKRKENNEVYALVPMTVSIYNTKVRQKLIYPRDFENEESLKEAFRETKKSMW